MRTMFRMVMWAMPMAGLLMTGPVVAGNLDATASPTNPASAMFTVNDIYNRLAKDMQGAKRAGSFVQPSGGPTNGTTRTLDEVMALLPSAAAPAPVPKTGQTTSYAAGDDGALTKGMAAPRPRFTDHGDGTVTDKLTGLMWTKDAKQPGQNYRVTWADAFTLVAAMNAANSGAGTYGHADWRMPSVKELFSLVDYNGTAPTLPIGHPFSNVQTGSQNEYWASTMRASPYLPVVQFGTGTVEEGYTGHSHFVWPVRGGAN